MTDVSFQCVPLLLRGSLLYLGGNRLRRPRNEEQLPAHLRLTSMLHDLRFAIRTLAKNPGFAAIAVTALALGIGVNATVFSLANAILFKNLPFADSEHVVYLTSVNIHKPREAGGISYLDFRDFQAQVKSFRSLGGHTGCLGNLSDSQAFPENYRCSQVTANTFAVIGQKPIMGRDFLPEDERPGAPPVVILSYRLWEKRYGNDRAILGR